MRQASEPGRLKLLALLAAFVAGLFTASVGWAQDAERYVVLQRADLTAPNGITLAVDISRIAENGDQATVQALFVFHDPTAPVAQGAAYVQVEAVFACSSRQVTAAVVSAFALDGSARPSGATAPSRAVAGPFEPLYAIACNGVRPPDGVRTFADATEVEADTRARIQSVGQLLETLGPGRERRLLALGTLENGGNIWALFVDRASTRRDDRIVTAAVLTVFEAQVENEAFRIEWVKFSCAERKMETLAKAGYGADGKMTSLQVREGEVSFEANSAAAAIRTAACAADDPAGAQSFPTYDAALAAAREAIRQKRAGA